jgi:hypothetical protein
VLWYNKDAIYSYYVIGHITGPEPQIRAQQMNVFSTLESLLYYPKSVLYNHVGMVLFITAIISLIVTVSLTFTRADFNQRAIKSVDFDITWALFFILICIVVIYAVLTIDVSKSPTVGNILVHPLLWMIMLAIFKISERKGRYRSHSLPARGMSVVAAVCLLVGIYVQIDRLGRHDRLTRQRSEIEQIQQLQELVFRYSTQLNLRNPTVSIDRVVDYFNYAVLKAASYERHGVLLNATPGLGGILSIQESEAIKQIQKSDFVVLTTPDHPEKLVYPFDIDMQTMHPKIVEVCNNSLILLQHFRFLEQDVVLYVRPRVAYMGVREGWVTSKGLTLTGPSIILRARPRIELRGKTNFAYLSKIPTVRAELRRPDATPKVVSASFQRLSGAGEEYRIIVDLESADVAGDVPLQIDLTFDTSFVPKDVGLSPDTNRLVVMAPRSIVLQQR